MPNNTHHTDNFNSDTRSPTLKRTWLTPRFECVSMEDSANATSDLLVSDGGAYS